MNSYGEKIWLFIPTRHRVKSSAERLVFRCPDNLMYERSFADPHRHYLWRKSLWSENLIGGWNCADKQPLVLSRLELVKQLAIAPPCEIASVFSDTVSHAFFILWLSDAVQSLQLQKPVAFIDDRAIDKLVSSRNRDEIDRQALTIDQLQSLSTHWEYFCSGNEDWLICEEESFSKAGQPRSFSEIVASVIIMTRGQRNDRNFDQEILYHLNESDWTPLSTIFTAVLKRGHFLPEESFVRRILMLSTMSYPSLIDIDVDLRMVSCFSAVRARLTASGSKIRDDRIGLKQVTLPLWIGGFDAR